MSLNLFEDVNCKFSSFVKRIKMKLYLFICLFIKAQFPCTDLLFLTEKVTLFGKTEGKYRQFDDKNKYLMEKFNLNLMVLGMLETQTLDIN